MKSLKEDYSNWERNNEIIDFRDVCESLHTVKKDLVQLTEDFENLNYTVKTGFTTVKNLSDGLIPVLGSDSISLTESSELVDSICARLVSLHSEIVISAERLIRLKKLLLSLSNQITVGDAEVLQRVISTFTSSLPKTKKTEHIYRSSASLVKALQPLTEQELLEQLSKTLPTDS
jgi:hypothetical protein